MAKRKRYDDEFRASAVLMLEAAGYPVGGDASIYGIFKIGDTSPFYIGTTQGDVQDRFKNHLYEVSSGRHANKHFANTVKKWGVDSVEARLVCTVPVHLRYHAERELIAGFVSMGGRLTNRIYNGLSFDITDAVYDYDLHRGLTQAHRDYLFSDEFLRPSSDPLVEKLKGLLMQSIDALVTRFPDDVMRECPWLVDLSCLI